MAQAGASGLAITAVSVTEKFRKAYKKLPPDIRAHADEALHDLMKTPRPASLRFEKLNGYRKPNIYTIHATPNHSHKISFELNGSNAILRNIDTHKLIDRQP